MLPLVFLGGVVAGAAGLTAAAFYDSHKTESQFSPKLKTPASLDAQDVTNQLNNDYFQAQSLYSKCNKVVFECGGLIFTPMPLPGDSIFRRAFNQIDGKMNGIARKNGNDRLRAIKEEARNTFDRYRGVFQRANQLVHEKGGSPINLDVLVFGKVETRLDNSIANENWNDDLKLFADSIRNFLDETCMVAQQLMDMLQDCGKRLALGNAQQNA